MKNHIITLLNDYNVDLLKKLQSENTLEDYLNKCNENFTVKFNSFLTSLGDSFVVNDEAEYNYFESVKNQIIINFFNSNTN